MRANEIKGNLTIKDCSPSVIARQLGVSRQAVSQVINGTAKSRRIRLAIAEALGKPIEQIWPDEPPAGEAERRGVNNLQRTHD